MFTPSELRLHIIGLAVITTTVLAISIAIVYSKGVAGMAIVMQAM